MENTTEQKLVPFKKKSAPSPSSSPAPAMTKEAFQVIYSEQISFLKDHQDDVKNFLSSFSSTGSDVAFINLENAKKVLSGMTAAKNAMEKLRSALKLRLAARLKEVS